MNLVTGSTGLLGAHVMLELLKRGEKVRALKRQDSDTAIVKELFHYYVPTADLFTQIEWVNGDVMDLDSLDSAIRGCSRIFHCAAIVSYHSADREKMYEVNIEGTANVVNTALIDKQAKICFVSSIAALGKAKNNDWIDEETEWIDSPFNTHYGITKNLSEMEVWRGIHEGLQGIVVNPGFIIGPGNFDRSSASIFRKLDEGLHYYPPGGTGFISAMDCASAMVSLMLQDISGERYILISENMNMRDVFNQISKGLDRTLPTKEATPFILQIARIGEWLKEIFTGRKALVTAESVKNSTVRFYYHNEKILSTLNTTFQPVSDAIQETAQYYKTKRSYR